MEMQLIVAYVDACYIAYHRKTSETTDLQFSHLCEVKSTSLLPSPVIKPRIGSLTGDAGK